MHVDSKKPRTKTGYGDAEKAKMTLKNSDIIQVGAFFQNDPISYSQRRWQYPRFKLYSAFKNFNSQQKQN